MRFKCHGGHIVALGAAIGAAFVMVSGHDGWGWLIAVVVIAVGSS